MEPATTDQAPNWTNSAVSQKFQKISGWLLSILGWAFWAKWIISTILLIMVLLWNAYILGKDVNANLTNDYKKIQESQQILIDYTVEFQNALLDPNINVSMNREPKILGKKATTTNSVVGGLRAPTNRIRNAKLEYSGALQKLIGISSRLSRGEVKDMAIPLYNAMQSVANKAGDLNTEVTRFQGSMWLQLSTSIF